MSRALVVLNSPSDREKVCRWAMGVPDGSRVEFKQPKRSIPQNDRMWAMLTELSEQLAWHGQKLTPDDWKLMVLDALKRESGQPLHIVPNTDGTGFVNLSTSSSDLGKGEMTDLIELIFAFGAKHGVTFMDDRRAA